MAVKRKRKRHEQLEMLNADGTKPKSTRGGKRPGAGRPPKGKRSSERHERRIAFAPSHPVHVVIRALAIVGSLRRRKMYQAIRWATIAVAKHEDFRIVQLSIQRTHVHLLVEANGKRALGHGMQAFQISAAKHINRMLVGADGRRRRGQVFSDRYHAEVITSPRQARHALSYVLNNWRKHEEDRRGPATSWNVDPFSSGWSFMGWKERERELLLWNPPASYEPLIVWFPKTWLLGAGWRRHGLVSYRERPSARVR
jgi:REP element-mobilizing transposase RayT